MSELERLHQAVLAILQDHEEGYPRPAAGAVVVNAAGQVLLGTPAPWGQRGLRSPHAALHDLPAGGVDEGETTLETAIREAREEGCVIARAVPGAPGLPRRGLRAFADPLSFGSPRRESESAVLSQAAVDLLRAAAGRCGLLDRFEEQRLAWFDALAETTVPWRSMATFHVLALVEEESFTPWEWSNRGWVDRGQLCLVARRSPRGRLAHLLEAGLEAWLDAAQQLAAG